MSRANQEYRAIVSYVLSLIAGRMRESSQPRKLTMIRERYRRAFSLEKVNRNRDCEFCVHLNLQSSWCLADFQRPPKSRALQGGFHLLFCANK